MANRGQFVGSVTAEGKLELINKSGWRALLTRLKGKQVVVTLGVPKRTRSDNQHRYYFGVVVTMLADELGYTKDEMHEALKYHFLRTEAEPEAGRVLATVRSTTKLTTVEFEDYMDRIRMWAAADLGIVLPLPNEQELWQWQG